MITAVAIPPTRPPPSPDVACVRPGPRRGGVGFALLAVTALAAALFTATVVAHRAVPQHA